MEKCFALVKGDEEILELAGGLTSTSSCIFHKMTQNQTSQVKLQPCMVIISFVCHCIDPLKMNRFVSLSHNCEPCKWIDFGMHFGTSTNSHDLTGYYLFYSFYY